MTTERTASGTARVLILEDEPIALLYLRRSFETRTSYHVEVASDAASAIDIAERAPVDILIADIFMDGMDGIEAARHITTRQDTEVIFVTASTDPDTRRRAEAIAPLAFRIKPADPQELIDLVDRAIAARRTEAQDQLQADFLLDTLYDTAQIGMCVTDENRRFVKVNRAYRRTYGYSEEELLGQEFTRVLPPEDREDAARVHDRFIAGELTELPAEWRVMRRDGEVRNIQVTAGRMIGTDGRPYKVTTVADITEWKEYRGALEEALEEKRLLLREVHHRVKNNLNTLSSLLNLQLEQHQGDERISGALTDSINRIKTMSVVYERLHQTSSPTSIDLSEYMQRLAHDLIRTSSGSERIELSLEIAAESVDIDTGIALGLIVNELLTNSVKHAFGSSRAGRVDMRIAAGEEGFTVDFQDSGPGLPDDFDVSSRNSLGMQLLQAIAGQRDGRIEVVDPALAHFRVYLPVT